MKLCDRELQRTAINEMSSDVKVGVRSKSSPFFEESVAESLAGGTSRVSIFTTMGEPPHIPRS